jgi:hypothetical protein
MNSVQKIFFKLNDREQILLLISLWVVLVICLFKFVQKGASIYEEWGMK